MTVVAAAAILARTADKPRTWLSVRHSLPSEAAAVLGLYGVYELARGLVVGDARDADHHAREVVRSSGGSTSSPNQTCSTPRAPCPA